MTHGPTNIKDILGCSICQ